MSLNKSILLAETLPGISETLSLMSAASPLDFAEMDETSGFDPLLPGSLKDSSSTFGAAVSRSPQDASVLTATYESAKDSLYEINGIAKFVFKSIEQRRKHTLRALIKANRLLLLVRRKFFSRYLCLGSILKH